MAKKRTHRNNNAPNDALKTPNPSEEGEFLVEEDRRQNSADNHGERAQGSDDDRFDESISAKVAQFTDDHHDHPRPP